MFWVKSLREDVGRGVVCRGWVGLWSKGGGGCTYKAIENAKDCLLGNQFP